MNKRITLFRVSTTVVATVTVALLALWRTGKLGAEAMLSPFELSVIGEGSITLDPPQPPGGFVPGTEVLVTAVPAEDWVFTQWGAGLPNLAWAPSQTIIPTPGPVDIMAFFDHRPGVSSLSMVEDLGAYLVAIGVYTDPAEVEKFDYDTGVEDLEGVVTVHLPNGIPDAAELLSLQRVMENPAIETKDSGVSHAMVWQLYQECLAQSQKDLSAQSVAVQRAVAACMTLGSFGHVGQLLKDVETHLGVKLNRRLYPNAGDRWFGEGKDMDRDGVTNKEEWEYTVERFAEAKGGPTARAAAYADAVSDPDQNGGGAEPLPDTGTQEDFFTQKRVP